MTQSVDIKISTKQRRLLQATTRGRIFLGGIGSGKSRVLCYMAIVAALRGKRGVICSFSYPNLRDVICHAMVESLEAFGLEPITDYTFKRGDMEFEIRGTTVMLRSADEPAKLRGISCNWFLLDEAREFRTDEVFTTLLGRIRESEEDFWGMCSTTKGKNWFYDLIKKEGLESAFETGYAANGKMTVVVQGTRENPFLPKAFLDEVEDRFSGKLAEQELLGKIVDWSAGVFEQRWFDNRDLYYKPPIGVRGWDLATSVKTAADFSAGVLLAKKDNIINVVDVISVKATYGELRELIVKTAIMDGTGVTVALESVGMQTAIVQDIMTDPRLAKHKVRAIKVTKDKLSRVLPTAPRFEQGVMRLCNAPWNEKFIEELCAFCGDGTGHDDMCDGMSIAYEVLTMRPVVQHISTDPPDFTADEKRQLTMVASLEIHEFKAYIVLGAWHPHKSMLQIVSEHKTQSIDEIETILKKVPKRIGPPELESDSLKSINYALTQRKCGVFTSKLDATGALYWLGQLTVNNNLRVPPGSRVYSELLTADSSEDFTPWVKCVLRLVQEVRSYPLPKAEEEYIPFRAQRLKAQAGNKSKTEDWVG